MRYRKIAGSAIKKVSVRQIRGIDNLRGIAILLVIYHHVYAEPLRQAVAHSFGVYPWIIGHGWMGVSIFCSDFVLALPFFVGSTRMESRQDTWRFVEFLRSNIPDIFSLRERELAHLPSPPSR
jgi:peptidoglycan/LPS O-acetylase OafA/YrhL